MTGLPRPKQPLFLLDYDGTLAEIVADPERALPHPDVPELLGDLSARYPLYLLTGRSLASLEQVLRVPGLEVVGIHGMEAGRLGEAGRTLVAAQDLAALAEVRQRLPVIPGLRLEDKGSALALHYREVGPEGIAALRSWAETVPQTLDTLWGKAVLELRPKGYGKGHAASLLAAKHRESVPIVIGDDTTDEEAFAALPHALTIKVGEGETCASARVNSVAEVVEYLTNYR